ncbi:MAG: hypothetical protein OXB93_03820 [Cytophagales bacterium]|nr:hypothetical protein [Cytophagales bacterium]
MFLRSCGVLSGGVLSLFLISSCATYYHKNKVFNEAFEQRDLEAAHAFLEKKKNPEKKKDRFIHYLDKGMLAHQLGNWEESNLYLEKAYIFGEDYKKNLGTDLGSTVDHGLVLYYGEYHEHLIPLYYKALNYLRLNDLDASLVECRRLDIRLQELLDRSTSKKKYTRDAFIHTLMGILYEVKGEYNNSFIAYRNAYEIYRDVYGPVFKIKTPIQLKRDLLKTARMNGFEDEYLRLRKEMNFKEKIPEVESSLGDVVLLWNNGLCPIKDEYEVFFVFAPAAGGFYCRNLDMLIPLPIGSVYQGFESVRITFPKYLSRRPRYSRARVRTSSGKSYGFELLEDVNALSFYLLRERMFKEISKVILRVAAKELLEQEARKVNPWLGLGADILGSLTERSDTRGVQTLPHSIFYTRISLPAGVQKLDLSFHGKGANAIRVEQSIEVESQKTVLSYVTTIDSHAPSD